MNSTTSFNQRSCTNRACNGWFGEAPMRHLIRQRIHAACQDLIATNHTAGTIAVD
ncbi:MAG: hypothetical protein WCO60_18105 [Verrucomicrobiota bacterium]